MIKVPVVINSGTITTGASVTGGALTIVGMGTVPPAALQLASATLATAVSETPGVVTITPSSTAITAAVANTMYSFSVTQYNVNTETSATFVIEYVVPTGVTATAGSICDNWRSQLAVLAASGQLQVTLNTPDEVIKITIPETDCFCPTCFVEDLE